MKPDIEELRKKYIKNPPEGMTSEDIRHMSGDDLLDMDYVYSCAGVPLFRRNGNRQSGGRKPLNRNRDTALKCLLPASLLA